jgi:hypothetical protein
MSVAPRELVDNQYFASNLEFTAIVEEIAACFVFSQSAGARQR